VFAALIFAKKLTDTDLIQRSIPAFGLLKQTRGGPFMIQDLIHADRDRKHPLKTWRPIASRARGTLPALTAALLLVAGSVMTGFLLSGPFGAVLLIYVVINLVYSFWLKEVVIIDVMAIASGFVLRAVAGAMIIGVEISHWLIMCTILLSLFLALCKRRQELESLEQAHEHRLILKEYSLDYIDQMINVVTPSTLLMYILYSVSPEVQMKLGTSHLYLTVPFVLYGIFRYLYLVHQKGGGGNPTTTLLTDRPLLICVGLWTMTVVVLLYGVGQAPG